MNRFHRWCFRAGHWRHAMHDQILLPTDVLAPGVPQLSAVEVDADLAARPRDWFP